MRAYIVYMTAPNAEEAERIGQALVEEGLAACVNVFSEGISSIYRWDGGVQSDDETAFIAKTTPERFAQLKDKVLELHPYDTPCVVAMPVEDGSQDFLDWIEDETAE